MTENKKKLAFDTECTIDYWLIRFQCVETGRTKIFELYEGRPLDRAAVIRILRNFTLVGFNSLSYDIPMVKMALKQGVTNAQLKKLNDALIVGRMKYWEAEKRFNLPSIDWIDHIDLIEPAPSVQVGLKLYMGRLNSQKLQDLPFDPQDRIFDGTPGKREQTVEYCGNDVVGTIDLYRHIEPQLELRAEMSKQYGVDVRSKSDAQIAEAVIRHELERIKGDKIERPDIPPDYSFQYQVPKFIKFKTQQMQDALDTIRNATFRLNKKEVKDDDDDEDAVQDTGGVKVKISGIAMPKEIKGLRIKMGQSIYKMGIGGLHSQEKRVSHYADEDTLLRDADVGAFYPALILICALYPDHLGPEFLDVYRSIRERRMSAKERIKEIKELLKTVIETVGSDDEEWWKRLTAEMNAAKTVDMTLKIVLNGTFGKLGSKWSFMYAPNLMIQVTITGQLALLMLIEELELNGISVISANTDGIVSKFDANESEVYHEIIKDWEQRTGFEMEFADYSSLHSMSVNSYIAIKTDGEVKQKGLCAFKGSKGSIAEKNPTNYIVTDAVINYLTKGTPLEDTIEWCGDIRRFLTVRRVTGGAIYKGEYLGKVVRWYKGKGCTEVITSAAPNKKGIFAKVSLSDGAIPMMELKPGLPSDLDYDYYISAARKMLGELGVL